MYAGGKMKRILSVEMMRESDRRTIAHFVSGRELMYRAGKAVFEILHDILRSDFSPNSQIAVVCGSGNNAGDGYVVAELLCEHGFDCTVIQASNHYSEDGRFYYEECLKKGVKIKAIADAGIRKADLSDIDLSDFDIVVDALLGTGFRVAPGEEMMRIIRAINRSGAFVVSVDINSALNGDNGMMGGFDTTDSSSLGNRKSEGMTRRCSSNGFGMTSGASCDDYRCVLSDLTISIGEWKTGHFLGIAKDVMKEKANVDIGIIPLASSMYLMEEADFKGVFRERKHFSNKSSYGYLALIGGSVEYSGAIRLAAMANAAMRAGAGVVRLAAPVDICHALIPEILEATLFPLSAEEFGESFSEDREGNPGRTSLHTVVSRAVSRRAGMARKGGLRFVSDEVDALIKNTKVVAFGMGVGTSADAREMLDYLIRTHTGVLIVDADGLTLLSEMDEAVLWARKCSLILTPHIKEMSRLLHCSISEIWRAPIEKAREMAKKLKKSFQGNPDSSDSSDSVSEDFGLSHSDFADIVLLKGPTTIVTDGETVLLVDAGCPGMATAGSGDVLSGILAAICANHSQLDFSGIHLPQNPEEDSFGTFTEQFPSSSSFPSSRVSLYATALAAFINGRAGELAQEEMGETAMIASDTIRKIPEVLRQLENEKNKNKEKDRTKDGQRYGRQESIK